MIQTEYSAATRTISTKYIGKITALEIIEYVNQLDLGKNASRDLLYFEDHTLAEFDFKAIEIKQIVHALYAKIKNLNSIKVALVNLKPKETAFSLIAIRLLKVKNMQAKIFCTSEAALDWLQMKKTVSNI